MKHFRVFFALSSFPLPSPLFVHFFYQFAFLDTVVGSAMWCDMDHRQVDALRIETKRKRH
jgi:hypothetical protein